MLMLTMTALLILIMIEADPKTIAYLSKNKCSNDEILNDSFVTMDNYYSTLRLRNYIAIGLVLLLLALDISMFTVNCWTQF